MFVIIWKNVLHKTFLLSYQNPQTASRFYVCRISPLCTVTLVICQCTPQSIPNMCHHSPHLFSPMSRQGVWGSHHPAEGAWSGHPAGCLLLTSLKWKNHNTTIKPQPNDQKSSQYTLGKQMVPFGGPTLQLFYTDTISMAFGVFNFWPLFSDPSATSYLQTHSWLLHKLLVFVNHIVCSPA